MFTFDCWQLLPFDLNRSWGWGWRWLRSLLDQGTVTSTARIQIGGLIFYKSFTSQLQVAYKSLTSCLHVACMLLTSHLLVIYYSFNGNLLVIYG